jgi:hypothetical protein
MRSAIVPFAVNAMADGRVRGDLCRVRAAEYEDEVTERPWQSLIRELRDSGFESPYLDRLRARHDVAAAQEELEKELIREMAEALGRSGEKVDVALLRLEVSGRALAAADDPAERDRLAAEFNALRNAALQARHELRIHREAVGIRRNDCLDTQYPIPPRA